MHAASPELDRQRSGARSGMRWRSRGGNPFVRHEFLLALERDGLRRSRHRLDAASSGARRRAARSTRRCRCISKSALVGRVRLRLELGARLRAGRPALLPEARQHGAVHAGDRALACWSHQTPRRACTDRALALDRATRASRRRVVRPPAVRQRGRSRSAASRGDFSGARTASSTGTTATTRASTTSWRRSAPRSARRRCANAGACRRTASRSARCAARRWTRACGTSCSVLREHVRSRAATSTISTWRSSALCRRHCPDAVMVKLAEFAGHADRGGDLLPRRRHALRSLLGRGRGVSQPAFRDLLLPGNRVLHRAGPAALRAGNAGRAQSAARLRAHADLVGALDRGSALPARDRQLPRAGARRPWIEYMRQVQEHVPFTKRVGLKPDASRQSCVARSSGSPNAIRRTLSAGRSRTARTRWSARRRRRPVPAAPARRVSTRHLSLVLARPADPVVVPGSARGAVPGELQRVAQSREINAQPRLTSRDSTLRSATSFAPAAAASCGRAAPGCRRKCAPPISSCTGWAMPTRSRPGRASGWSAACTASRSGAVFFGESMFSIERDASKVALQAPVRRAASTRGFHMIDCQMATPHLMSLGAQLIPRPSSSTCWRATSSDAAAAGALDRRHDRHPLTATPRLERRPRCNAARRARAVHCIARCLYAQFARFPGASRAIIESACRKRMQFRWKDVSSTRFRTRPFAFS